MAPGQFRDNPAYQLPDGVPTKNRRYHATDSDPVDGVVAEPAAKPAREPLIDWRPALEDELITVPGAHPKFGRGNWGVSSSEYWGDFGSTSDTSAATSRTATTPESPSSTTTANESRSSSTTSSGPVTSRTARAQRSSGSTVTRSREGCALTGYGGAKKCRISVLVADDTLTVREYDWNAIEPFVICRD
jgi:hypothetical protein